MFTFCSSTATVLRGRESVLRYTYIASRVQIVSIARIITIEPHKYGLQGFRFEEAIIAYFLICHQKHS